LERVATAPENKLDADEKSEKLTTSKLAQKLGIKTNELIEKLFTYSLIRNKRRKALFDYRFGLVKY
jgi:hypothetical protein